MAKTPTYHVFHMYLPFQDATLLPVQVDAPMLAAQGGQFPAFTVTAARGKDGKVHVAVANMDKAKAYAVRLTLSGLKARSVRGEILTHDRLDAHNAPGQPAMIAPRPYTGGRIADGALWIDVPTKAVVVVSLD